MAEITLTDDTFGQEVLKSDIPVMVDFWAEWCAPCRIISPLIEELGHDYEGKIKVGKMNVDEHSNAPANYGIMSIPTVIIFKNGKPVETLIGVQPKDNFKKSIDAALTS
ncbi:MAG: thioredoxin [Candidatus Levybacteria bacterium RIFCSPHIGHO2_01_FULL_40_15b]|nr:MAG: thioredoxin [Candidatus Levybacteria bacterium RIFCSPHIGHO2_01_FULL_40_15b]